MNRVLAAILVMPVVFVINNLLAMIIYKVKGGSGGIWLFAAVSVSQALLLIGLTLYLAVNHWKLSLADLGLEGTRRFSGIVQGLVQGPLVFLLVSFGGILVELFHPLEDDVQPFTQMILEAGAPVEIAILCFFGVVLAPLSEELYFRGLLFPVLRKHIGLRGGILISGFIFGLMHFDPLRLLPLALGGMALAWLYQKTGSLYSAITAHGVWNGLMLLILLLTRN